jgi:hypothetical protein
MATFGKQKNPASNIVSQETGHTQVPYLLAN